MNPFREKLLTLQISPKVRDISARKNYFDSEPVDRLFGEDSKEQMMEETQGLGYVRESGGRLYHKNRFGEVEQVSDDMALAGPEYDG